MPWNFASRASATRQAEGHAALLKWQEKLKTARTAIPGSAKRNMQPEIRQSDGTPEYSSKVLRGNSFSCDHCGREFQMKWKLNRHISDAHGSKQNCGFCGKTFKSMNGMRRHQRKCKKSSSEETAAKPSPPQPKTLHSLGEDASIYASKGCAGTLQKLNSADLEEMLDRLSSMSVRYTSMSVRYSSISVRYSSIAGKKTDSSAPNTPAEVAAPAAKAYARRSEKRRKLEVRLFDEEVDVVEKLIEEIEDMNGGALEELEHCLCGP